MLNLGARLVTLREVQVHLVTVEVRIVGRGNREVQPEGREGQYLASVTHDTHFVQRGLTVKENEVTVLKVTLNSVAVFELEVTRTLDVPQVKAGAVVANDKLGARPLVGAHFHLLTQTLKVQRSHRLAKGQRHRNGLWHADDVDGQVRVSRDDSTRREVHTLAHEVATQTPVLAL
ncbi:CDP-glycerol:poly(glycerophosphate) glycerophosphotransferase, putative [Babesia caballi]|uniref:CDP-glycerol:poly(Glycerophosphate) glycerophosphotransferase, putative n=1 Tax=Babesia caballi TaxID=5871 RepID=A0AAV4LW34_BABCB|nr:CDP-glycerol:poly(glycerophosphate) glycerophosphotransferase, putative [Babesia caballi]